MKNKGEKYIANIYLIYSHLTLTIDVLLHTFTYIHLKQDEISMSKLLSSVITCRHTFVIHQH